MLDNNFLKIDNVSGTYSTSSKNFYWWAWGHTSSISTYKKHRQNFSEFEASLIYTVSSRLHSETLPKKLIIIIYVHAYLCLCVDMCTWVQVASECRKGHQTPSSGSYRWLVVVSCHLNAGNRAQGLLTAEPYFQTLVKRVSLVPCVQRKEHKGTVKILEKIIIKHLHKVPCGH